MPYRDTIFQNSYFYHVYNRGINRQVIFTNDQYYKRATDLMLYYSYKADKVKFSNLAKLPQLLKQKHLDSHFHHSRQLVEIIAYCLMPTHFHFLLKQVQDNGISKFLADFQNSYTRYFNTKENKFGPILQGRFKSVYIENDNQLNHLSRYIHLNPYSSQLIKNKDEIVSYQWSSLKEYLETSQSHICNLRPVLDDFRDIDDYKQFVLEQADYQLELKLLEHVIIESE